MKRLLYLSQASTKVFIISCWFLLSPYSLLGAQALNQGNLQLGNSRQFAQKQESEILLSQATTSDADAGEDTDSNSQVATFGRTGIYNLEFQRIPNLSRPMRLIGLYSERSLTFTRPRSWNVTSVKALIRFRHSTVLYPDRSSLTVLVNDTAVGSIPLDRKRSQTGQLLVDIPTKLLKNYNELKIAVRQRNDEICVHPYDPGLWAEIQQDSKLIFNYKLKPASENFSSYPHPIVDELGLESNQVNYLEPNQINPNWLSAASTLQASLGRKTNFRSLDTKLVSGIANITPKERLVVIGTPNQQAALADLDLPVAVRGNQILDEDQNPLAEDQGVLMLTRTNNGAPVLVVTGNGEKGVEKAIQFLVQSDTRKIGTGPVVFVDEVPELASPRKREWPRYLPEKNSFKLSEIEDVNGQKYKDMTVRGGGAAPIVIDFRALPDDRFIRGSSMNLVYSYGPQVNPRTSAIEVLLDGNPIGGQRLAEESGETRKTLKVDLPPKLIKPNSKIEVFFRMNPREGLDNHCRNISDGHLVGTVHNETSFNLKREISVKLPDLELLRFGFPFASPQDLSKTSIVVPQNPSKTDILTLLEFSERLGALSQASSVKLDVYTPDTLSSARQVRNSTNIVAIGTHSNFPLPEVLEKSQGFNLNQSFIRLFGNNKAKEKARIQAPIDSQGVIKEIISPWNRDRVVLALTAQTETGLDKVRQVLDRDPWFFQLEQDTALISSDVKTPNPDDENAFELEFLKTTSSRRIEKSNPLTQMSRLLQENWLLLLFGTVGVSLLMYGIVQLYLKRLNSSDNS